MEIITVACQKGGVAKTTVAVNLSAALALAGKRVLIVDCDSQKNASRRLLKAEAVKTLDEHPNMSDVFRRGVSLESVIIPSERPGLDLAPGGRLLVEAAMELVNKKARESVLKRALRALPPSRYDFVVCDVLPSQDLIVINALSAASHVLIPFNAEADSLEGIEATERAVREINECELGTPTVLGCIQVMADRRTGTADGFRKQVLDAYGPLVFESSIRINNNFTVLSSWNMDIFAYEATQRRPHKGCDDFAAAAQEVLRRLASSSAQAAA